MSYFIGVSQKDESGVKTGTRNRVWDGVKPLNLGYPSGWRIENKNGKVWVKGGCESFPLSPTALTQGTIIDLNSGRVSLTIRPRKSIPAAFSLTTSSTDIASQVLRVSFCRGSWGVSSERLSDFFVGKIGGLEAFSVEKRGDGFVLSPYMDGLEIEILGAKSLILTRLNPLMLERDKLLTSTILFSASQLSWRFNQARVADLPLPADGENAQEAEENIFFRKSLVSGACSIALLAAVCLILPGLIDQFRNVKPEMVSEQYAKISPVHSGVKSLQVNPPSGSRSAQVQAYRSEGFSHSLSQLMKGGMTKLLAESDIGGGEHLLQQRSGALHDSDRSTSSSIGLSGEGSKMVAMGGGFGKGVGYGKGDHASVSGQGHSFVAMDNSKSTVEEGLTRDEVGEVIHQHISEVRYCYESSMLRLPQVEGKLLMGFTIGGNGSVRTAEVKSSTLPDAKLDDCILRRLVGWKFPNTKGGVDVAVSYPFIFKTLGG